MIAAAVEDGDHAAAAVLAIGFEGALRASDLRSLRVESTNVRDNKLLLFVSRSKSDQTHRGAQVVVSSRPDAPFDAVAIALAWRRRIGRSSGPLFAHGDLEGGVDVVSPICTRSILRIVKRYVARVGFEDVPLELVGAHSLRAGWATEELDLETPAVAVAAHLRHADLSTVMAYYRPRQHHNLTSLASSGDRAR